MRSPGRKSALLSSLLYFIVIDLLRFLPSPQALLWDSEPFAIHIYADEIYCTTVAKRMRCVSVAGSSLTTVIGSVRQPTLHQQGRHINSGLPCRAVVYIVAVM